MLKIKQPTFGFEDYLTDDLIPSLFVGYLADTKYKFKDDLGKNISHQTAGYACNQIKLHGILLESDNPIVTRLSRNYIDSCISRYPSLETLNSYNAFLKGHGLSCENDYDYFQEAFYPIDLIHFETLTGMTASEFVSSYMVATEESSSIFKLMEPWWMESSLILAVLGDNCD